MKNYDFIVLGLGAMGSATLYQLAKRGDCQVLGIDQFSPPHSMGSTHGETRITRQAIGENENYTALSLRSYELFREVEAATGKTLLTVTGGLIVSSPAKTSSLHVPDFFENTLRAAKKYNISHSLLDAREIRERFPQFNVRDDEVGYYENNAGFLRPEQCIGAHLEQAEKLGADIKINEKVLSFKADAGNSVTVTTDKGKYAAQQLIICAGPWLPQWLGENFRQYFTVRRQVMYWFQIKDDITPFVPGNFPVFIWQLPNSGQSIYGFPAGVGEISGGLKIATEQDISTNTPEDVNRTVSDEEIREMYEKLVAPYFPAVSGSCLKAVTCLYTITPDSGFVIDRHPDHSNLLIVSPCSGHGFKHSAAIGEMVSQLAADGESTFDVSGFNLARLLN